MEAKQRRAIRSGRLNPNSNTVLPRLPPHTPLHLRVIIGTRPGYEGSLEQAHTSRTVAREARRQAAWATSVDTHRTPAPVKHTPSIRPSQKFIINA